MVKWKYSEFNKMNGNFKNIDIVDIEKLEGDYNTIIFPKSISEFDEVAFQHLKDIIGRKEFRSKRVVLVGAIRRSRMESDMQRLEKITDIFIKKHGYLVADSETNIPSLNSPYIYQVASDITYPVEIKDYIVNLNTKCAKYKKNGVNCEFSCSELLRRYPVLKTSQMTFKIIYLER